MSSALASAIRRKKSWVYRSNWATGIRWWVPSSPQVRRLRSGGRWPPWLSDVVVCSSTQVCGHVGDGEVDQPAIWRVDQALGQQTVALHRHV